MSELLEKFASATDDELYDTYCVLASQAGIALKELTKRGFFVEAAKKKKGPGRGSKTPKPVKQMAEKLKGKHDIKEPYGLATYIVEREKAKGKIKGETKHNRKDYEEVKALAGD